MAKESTEMLGFI